MKRLVTQFDEQRTRATVATPTCCCCCCCCCVASIATVTAVTVLNANELTGQSQMPGTRRSLYSVGAFLALPLAVLAGTAAARLFTLVYRDGAPAVGLISGIVAWAALLGLLYRQLGPLRSARATAITMVAAAVLFWGSSTPGSFSSWMRTPRGSRRTSRWSSY